VKIDILKVTEIFNIPGAAIWMKQQTQMSMSLYLKYKSACVYHFLNPFREILWKRNKQLNQEFQKVWDEPAVYNHIVIEDTMF